MNDIGIKSFELFLLHLGESTVFALIAVTFASALRLKKAKNRYLFYQLALLKFLLPIGVIAALAFRSFGASSETLNELVVTTVSKSSDYVANQASGGWIVFLLGTWIGGVLCMTIAHGIGLSRVRKLVSDSSVPDDSAMKRIHKILARTGFASAGKLPFFINNRFASIGIAGFFRPRIIINATFLDALSDEELLAAFKHELAHVDRRDNLWHIVHASIVTLFWFHPVAWILRYQLRLESELACDEAALLTGESPRDYAECLLKAASYHHHYKNSWVTAFTAKSLKMRIRKIVNFEKGKESIMKLITMHLVAFCVAGLFLGASTHLHAIGDAGQETTYELKDLDTHPKPLHQVQPKYPYELKKQGIAGWVKLEWVIDSQGNVVRPKVLESSLRDFEQPAIQSILESKWHPGTKAGKAVSVRVRQRMDFQP